MSGAALIWCPFPDADTARQIAGQLLADGLIACVNILPEIESLFLWQGKADTAREAGALFKTTCDRLDTAIERIGALHPYETPAIIGWHSDSAHPATLNWLAGSTPPLV